MNQKEMISKAASSIKNLLRAASVLQQCAYDMHFEQDVASTLEAVSAHVTSLADDIQKIKLAYAGKINAPAQGDSGE
jgi:hydrogenase maturation factor HypF (carbamoyltransferase family)